MLQLFLLSVPAAVLTFLFESYPRFLNREYGVDIWTHLLYLKEYRKQKGIPGEINQGFLVTGEYDYPPAFISILSKFSDKLVRKYEFLFSPFFDSIHVVIIFIISFYMTGNIAVSIIAQIIYILTPIVILENSSATPRSLGYTLFTIVMTSLIFFSQTLSPFFLILAIFSGSLIFLSHRFTTQGFLFFSIIFGIVEQNIYFPATFVASLILAIIISRGFYINVYLGHIGNLKFWIKNINYRFAHQVKGNLNKEDNKDFIFKIYNKFVQFPPFVLQITNPWILFVLYLCLFEIPSDRILYTMMIWVLTSYILAVTTIWIPSLRFLGEGQRYLELSAFPAAFLASYFLITKINTNLGYPLVALYLIIGILSLFTILVIQRKAIIVEKIRTLTPPLKRMYKFLKSMRTKPRLLCIPHQITTNTIFHTGCPVYVNASYATIDKISDVYPFIKKPIEKLMADHKLDMILLNEEYSSINSLNLKKYKIIKKIENFSLIKPL